MTTIEELERRVKILEAYVQTQLNNKYYGSWDSTHTLPPISNSKCLHDNFDKDTPVGVSCPCRKCTAYCMGG